MARKNQIDQAIDNLRSEIEVLQAALARLQRQKDEQQAKKAVVAS